MLFIQVFAIISKNNGTA